MHSRSHMTIVEGGAEDRKQGDCREKAARDCCCCCYGCGTRVLALNYLCRISSPPPSSPLGSQSEETCRGALRPAPSLAPGGTASTCWEKPRARELPPSATSESITPKHDAFLPSSSSPSPPPPLTPSRPPFPPPLFPFHLLFLSAPY